MRLPSQSIDGSGIGLVLKDGRLRVASGAPMLNGATLFGSPISNIFRSLFESKNARLLLTSISFKLLDKFIHAISGSVELGLTSSSTCKSSPELGTVLPKYNLSPTLYKLFPFP